MHAGSHWVETINTVGGGDSVVCASVIIHISRVRMLPGLRMLSNYLLSERTKYSPSVGWGGEPSTYLNHLIYVKPSSLRPS